MPNNIVQFYGELSTEKPVEIHPRSGQALYQAHRLSVSNVFPPLAEGLPLPIVMFHVCAHVKTLHVLQLQFFRFKGCIPLIVVTVINAFHIDLTAINFIS